MKGIIIGEKRRATVVERCGMWMQITRRELAYNLSVRLAGMELHAQLNTDLK